MEAERGGAGLKRRLALMTVLLLAGSLLAGCGGGSSSHTITNAAVKPGPGASGTKTFNANGIALHFSYPASFRVGSVHSVGSQAGNTSGAINALVEIDPLDGLTVTRLPRLRITVTRQRLPQVKPNFDATFTRGPARISVARSPRREACRLAYPPVAIHAVPTPVSDRVTAVFLGAVEYELNCQYTAAHDLAVISACNQMLATLHR